MPQLFTNNARATLVTGIAAGDTTITIEAGKADLFPSANVGTDPVPSTDNWFKATLQDSLGNVEIVYVRSRSLGSGVLSNVIRGREGTTARAFTSGTVVGLRITAADIEASLGQVTAEKIAANANSSWGLFRKIESSSPAFFKTNNGAVSIKAGTIIGVNGVVVVFSADSPVVMPTLTAGTDYSIWCTPAGALQAAADLFNAPAAAPVTGAIKIGGFHYGLVAPGTTVAGGSFNAAGSVTTGGMVWTQAQVDDIAGINKYSIWDLKWRSAGEQHGFALDPMSQTWVAIYFAGTNHITNGVSRYNTDVASGTVLPRVPTEFGGNGTLTYPAMTWWASNEIARSHRARLLTEAEFVSAAFGVTENQSLGGAESTIPATTRQAGYTSRIGIEQATGHIWTWGADSSTRWDGTGGWAWRNNNGGRGQMYIGGDVNMVRVLLGGARAGSAFSGSRASHWNLYPWYSVWDIGLRAACDHLQLA